MEQQMHNRTEDYFSALDNFGSEVGSSLDVLATEWDENDIFEENNGRDRKSSMAELGKRYAKPLFFNNPVYKMVYKDFKPQQVKRPTLIPIPQPNGNDATTDAEQPRRTSAGKLFKTKKLSPRRNPGIISRLTAAARRHSHSKTIEDSHSVSGHSTTSTHSHSSVDTSPERSPSVTSSSPVKQAAFATSDKPFNVAGKTANEVPAQDETLLVKPTTNAADSESISVIPLRGETPEKTSPRPVPSPRRSRADIYSNADFDSREANTPTLDSSNISKSVAADEVKTDLQVKDSAANSFTSSTSEDGPSSDLDVKTMADVIGEFPTEDVHIPPTQEVHSFQETEEKKFLEKPGLLQRNRTLRWTGTRKALPLMREFTRKRRELGSLAPEIDSPSAEVEFLTKQQKSAIVTGFYDHSRPNTPSQQTTSFGMGDDDFTPEDALNNDSDLSSSECSDAPLAFNEEKLTAPSKLRTTEPARDIALDKRENAFITLSSLLPPAPRLRRTQSSKVRAYLQKLGSSQNNALGYAVIQFVDQTLRNAESRPLVLLHDIRSFLTDIKHYFISNPHVGLAKKIQKMVGNNNYIDVEGAVDDALDRLVLYPLHDMVYRCLVVDYRKSGQLTLMQEAIGLAKKKTTKELGIRETLIPPDFDTLEIIKGHFIQLQRTYSPYFKLKELLAAVTMIYHNTRDLNTEDQSARKIGADDFLPLLVYSIVHCDFLAADIEAQYIDGLLEPSLLLGEGGYYLTTLISAIQVVFSIKRKETALPNISDLQGFLKVGISPSESNPYNKEAQDASEVVLHKTLHVPPAMTCLNLCQMISKKFNVAVPQNYCMHVVVNGVAHALEANECPQLVKMDLLTQFPASSFYFCYQKRNIATTPCPEEGSQSNDETLPERDDVRQNSNTTEDSDEAEESAAEYSEKDILSQSEETVDEDEKAESEAEGNNDDTVNEDDTAHNRSDCSNDQLQPASSEYSYHEDIQQAKTTASHVTDDTPEEQSNTPGDTETILPSADETEEVPKLAKDAETSTAVKSVNEELQEPAEAFERNTPTKFPAIQLHEPNEEASYSTDETATEFQESSTPISTREDCDTSSINSSLAPKRDGSVTEFHNALERSDITRKDNENALRNIMGWEDIFPQRGSSKRKSCMAKENVASLTQYFEKRGSTGSSGSSKQEQF